jgi:D-aminoacyl-tRNA deacylase
MKDKIFKSLSLLKKMTFCVICSKKDPAGLNIISELNKINNKIPTFIEDKEIIFLEDIDKKHNFDFIIFASKHQSSKNVQSLTIHSIGNWKNANFGGKSGLICPSSSLINKKIFQILNKNSQEIKDFLPSMEVTHHGPYIEKPSLFIEIGSSVSEWENPLLGKIIAKTINDFLVNPLTEKYPSAIAIGGLHYCQSFNEIQLGKKFAISHTIPEYVMPLTEEMLNQAIEKTVEKTEYFILDWKGLGNSEKKQESMKVIEKISSLKKIKLLRTRDAR